MYLYLSYKVYIFYLEYDYIYIYTYILTDNMYIEINTSRLFTRFIYATYRLNQNNSKLNK